MAGIIIDASFQSNVIENIIIGVGINYKIKSKELEKRITAMPNFYGADSLLNESQTNPPITLVKDFIHELEKKIGELSDGKKSKIIKEWTKNSETINKKVIINTANGKISGTAKKIDGDGALIVKTRRGDERILVGDVTINQLVIISRYI